MKQKVITSTLYCNQCLSMIQFSTNMKPFFNTYDISKSCYVPKDSPPSLCYNFKDLTEFFNSEKVSSIQLKKGRKWVTCNTTIWKKMLSDMYLDASLKLKEVLDADIKVLGYYGDKDFICNWEGGLQWMNSLEWSGQNEFNNANVKNVQYGLKKTFKNFTFVKVFGAGHMVPMDQPKEALDMIVDFIFFN